MFVVHMDLLCMQDDGVSCAWGVDAHEGKLHMGGCCTWKDDAQGWWCIGGILLPQRGHISLVNYIKIMVSPASCSASHD